jgi:nucleoside-diphosphate-sugar epimerase
MAEGDGKTVLVTGGSGFLGGWCIIDLLQRGYRVRTTVRDPSRERDVHAAVESQVGQGPHLTVHQADLMSDDHWDNIIEGCDYVLHVASPFPPKQPKNPDDLILPAREGTLRVLRTALDHDVKRIVVTSSIAAIRLAKGAQAKVLDEDDWRQVELVSGLRGGADVQLGGEALVNQRGEEDRLATINPGAIIGPVLHDDVSYSLQAIQRLLDGGPGVPRLGFSFVDVRDVADLEIRAMTAPEAAGQRFIAVTQFMWMVDAGKVLRERLGDEASKVPTRTVPDLLVRGLALFDGGIRSVVGGLGKRQEVSSEKARTTLGWSPRPIEDTIAETGETLIHHGVVESRAAA